MRSVNATAVLWSSRSALTLLIPMPTGRLWVSSDPQLEILYFFKLVLPGSVPGAGGRRRSQTFGFQRRVWDEKEGPVEDRVQLFRKKWPGFEVRSIKSEIPWDAAVQVQNQNFEKSFFKKTISRSEKINFFRSEVNNNGSKVFGRIFLIVFFLKSAIEFQAFQKLKKLFIVLTSRLSKLFARWVEFWPFL